MLANTNLEEGKTPLQTTLQKTLFIGFDTEYTQNDSNHNKCLSYQLVVMDSNNQIMEKIYYPNYDNDERLTFNELLLLIFQTANIPESEINDYYIEIIGHFVGVDIAMLKDREKVYSLCELIYKTAITLQEKTIQMELLNGEFALIHLNISDTIILLPPSHKSLAKASSLLGEEYYKKELSDTEKSNMLQLLIDNKPKFEEYALHDAKITLHLYITLQKILNNINDTKDKRYTTIGKATTTYFKKFIKEQFKDSFNNIFEEQFGRKNSIYLQGLNLAKRSYMGGLNNSFILGESSGELILDIDFSSAYPTVMNLLEVSYFGEKVEFVKAIVDENFSIEAEK
jgi:hypothetical protein